MRVAVLGLGTRGDLYPLLGIGRRLTTLGHDVVVLEFDEYARDVADAGLAFVAVAPGSQCEVVFRSVPPGPLTASTAAEIDKAFCMSAFQGAPAFVTACRSPGFRADALLAPAYHPGATMCAELLGVPLVSVFFGMSLPEQFDERSSTGLRTWQDEVALRLVDRFAAPQVAALRAAHGVSSTSASFARMDRAGGLVLAPAPLADRPAGLPPAFEVAGYPGYYGPPDRDLPAHILEFVQPPGPPVVVCSVGDGWARELPEALMRLAPVASTGQLRLVVVSGRAAAAPWTPGTLVVGGADLTRLLAYAHVSVNHAGMGTLVAALRNGVPSVTLPRWPDGARNARRLTEQGLGLDVGNSPDPDDVRRAIDAVLADHGRFQGPLAAARHNMEQQVDPAVAFLDQVAKRRHWHGTRTGRGRPS